MTAVLLCRVLCVPRLGVHVQSLELDDKIVAFQWEPRGCRFAVIHTEGTKTHVSFYAYKKKKIKLQGARRSP